MADLGWKGYYIEPVPEYFGCCRKRHAENSNITVSHCAIGAESGRIEINIGGPLSTIRSDVKTNFESLWWAKNLFTGDKVVVEQLLLEDFLLNNKIQTAFDLLVIDVEGYEWNVIQNFNIKQWQPKMVIIELHDQNNDYMHIWEDC